MRKLISVLLALMMIAGTFAMTVSAASPFTDVSESRWSYGSILYAYDKGYMNGTGNNKFSPAASMTRGMVVTVLYRMEGSPSVRYSDIFTDVQEGTWYTDAVIWAKNAEVVNGTTDDTFSPESRITREQLVTMLYRFCEYRFIDVTGTIDLSSYTDSDKIHEYALDAFRWAVSESLISGMSENILSPRTGATREQFATILERFDNTDFSYITKYNEPVMLSTYTEPEYVLVNDADFYVSVNGDDTADGSFEHPFATFNKAVEAVRELKATKTEGDIKVAFMAGDYGELSVRLSKEDSGTESQRIIYCAYGDGDVTFNNGFDVRLSEFVALDESEKAIFNKNFTDKIMKVDISDRLTADKYDPATILLMNDEGPLSLCRWPNKFPDGTDDLFYEVGYTVDENHIRITHPVAINKIAKYHTTENLYLYGYLTTGWYKDILETSDYDYDTHTFYIPHPETSRAGHLRYIELDGFDSAYWNKTALINISEELDYKGEFWIDQDTMVMYVYDPAGDYHFTGGGDMINIQGTEYITFRGLDFTNCETEMIHANGNPTGLTIEECSFKGGASRYMVEILGGSMTGVPDGTPIDATVRGCEFSLSAGTALKIDADSNTDYFNTGTGAVVDNNYFTMTNIRLGNMGALNVCCPGVKVTHNYFKKCYWEGVDFRGCANMTAEYNVFDQVCYNGDDTGVLNNWSCVKRCGNLVRYNVFINIKGGTNGRYSLYLDDTAGTRVENNLYYNCSCPAMNNGISKYNTFCGNVLIYSEGGCAYNTGATDITEEAIAAGDISRITSHEYYTRWAEAFSFFDSRPDQKAIAEEMWDGYFDITTDTDRWNEAEFCMNSSLTICDNIIINRTGETTEYEEKLVKYSTISNNTGYTDDINLYFVNPALGDYTVKNTEGAPDIPFGMIGRY